MLHLDDLRRGLADAGAEPVHAHHLLRRWLRGQPLVGGRRAPEHFLPKSLREALPAVEAALDRLAVERSRDDDGEGATRLLLALADGNTVESVLLPREGLCVSTQVGCAVGCTFCMTGRDGLLRQLGSAEIVAQVALARRLRPVRKVVFMGMGEPAHNLEAVLAAIELLAGLGGVGHKDLVFSTVGDERAFAALAASPVRPALALSLHTTKDGLRRELLPRAPRLDVRTLVEAAVGYAELGGYPVQLQWTLLEGVNDGDDEVQALAGLLSGQRRVMVNLIPWNTVAGSGHRRPAWERAAEMARSLNRLGVYTRLRRSAGQGVDGGCGQLRARERPVVLRRRPPDAQATGTAPAEAGRPG